MTSYYIFIRIDSKIGTFYFLSSINASFLVCWNKKLLATPEMYGAAMMNYMVRQLMYKLSLIIANILFKSETYFLLSQASRSRKMCMWI